MFEKTHHHTLKFYSCSLYWCFLVDAFFSHFTFIFDCTQIFRHLICIFFFIVDLTHQHINQHRFVRIYTKGENSIMWRWKYITIHRFEFWIQVSFSNITWVIFLFVRSIACSYLFFCFLIQNKQTLGALKCMKRDKIVGDQFQEVWQRFDFFFSSKVVALCLLDAIGIRCWDINMIKLLF